MLAEVTHQEPNIFVSHYRHFYNNVAMIDCTAHQSLYIHIPPCPPEDVAVSEDEEGTVGTRPERGGVEMSWSHVQFYAYTSRRNT